MKPFALSLLSAILGCALFVSTANALPMASDAPSPTLVVQCGVPAEFSATTPPDPTDPQSPTSPSDNSGDESKAVTAPAAVPEPSTIGLIGLGLGLVAAFRLFKRTPLN